VKICALFLIPVACLAMDKVIFDTDCGYFGDDGSALVMLMRSPEKVRLVGLTTVSGNVWAASSAGYLREIVSLLDARGPQPVVGAQMPLLHSPELARQETAIEFLGAFADPMAVAPPGARSALNLLADEIRAAPGEVTVLALGPMTNIAALLRFHPDLETKIRRLVFMGGNVHVKGNASPAAEFNFWFDPEAAAIVLRSKIPEKVMFPLDICNRAVLTKALFDQVVAVRTPVTSRYREDYGMRYPGFLKRPDATGFLWDELAAAWLLDTGFVTRSETAYLDVDTHFGANYGATVPLDRKMAPGATPVRVMLDLDFPRVFALYRKLLTE
jgi:inosine-uridine nucleoside N-ribohydrolase